MTSTESYIIFEPDQVLTNDHLNELFDYLDTQERLTRNKLIGIGIACGLEITNQTGAISISKGCGVTSKGYLVVWDDATLTQYVSYTLPANPLYSPFINQATNKQYELLRLITDDEAKAITDTKSPVAPVLKDMVAVLFLEANETDLKNCDTQDCNEKGKQMDLTIRPLLIAKKDMEDIILKQKKLSGDDDLSNSYIERLGLQDIPFKRFDVKATLIADAFDIYNAYLRCMDDVLLKSIADAYSQSFSIFQSILPAYGKTNPFGDLQAKLKAKLDAVKKSLPIYLQYFYDFLDDLVKAYQEFKEKSFEVITECCPDEDLFPMHLMLGEADVNTQDNLRSPFRQYFVSSPIFNNQGELVKEVRLLFDRMANLTANFFVIAFNPRQTVPIRITPSKWSSIPLSQRAIPYYYNINKIAPFWNAGKTKKGKSNFNLSYNADKYAVLPPDNIMNPLLYGIESYDFYRIEGHIGQDFTSVLGSIISQRNANRLPFDVIALKAGTDATDTAITYNCHFEDLEAQFKLISAELACKMHEPLCIAAKVPSLLRLVASNTSTPFSFMETFSGIHSLALQDVVAQKNVILTNFIQTTRFTKKGEFLKTYCPVTEGTLGNEYIQSANKFFPRPSQIDLTTTAGSKAALMHLIDSTEALMQTITGASTIFNFNYTNFNRDYDDTVSYFTEFMQSLLALDSQDKKMNPLLFGMLQAVVTSCIDEKLKALTDEYAVRVAKIQKQNLFSQYISTNPGIDHKAGVPRGGTFIIVYHEASTVAATAAASNLNTLSNANIIAAAPAATTPPAAPAATGPATQPASGSTAPVKKLSEATAITHENLSRILNIFNTSNLQLTTAQATQLKTLTLQNFAAATVKDPFTIPDRAVVADFYLPYLCCSDCPPIAYILPKLPQVFSLDPTTFCSNDQQAYKFKVDPPLTDVKDVDNPNNVVLDTDNNGNLSFTPSKQNVQQTTNYHLAYNGTGIDLSVVAAFDADFTPQSLPSDPLSFKFVATNITNRKVEWDFGDATPVSTDPSPVHAYKASDAEQNFTVSLTITDGPCVIKKTHDIKITPPKPIFSIDPAVYCFNDEVAHAFSISPAIQDVSAIENKNNLNLNLDATGKLSFVPSQQGIQQTTGYHLAYKGIGIDLKIIAITGLGFSADPVATDPLSRKFTPINIGNGKPEWNFGDGTPVSTEVSPVHSYHIDNDQTFQVSLTVNDSGCKASTVQAVAVSRPKPNAFSIQPLVFCSNDKSRKQFNVQPMPADIAEVTNPDKLLIEKDTAGLFFIPNKQDIGQSRNFALTYKGIAVGIKIIVPDAGFTMKFDHNPSPVAVFPTILTLSAKDPNADSYSWALKNVAGAVRNFQTKDVTVNIGELNIPPNAPFSLSIVLTTGYKNQTGVDCNGIKDYNVTDPIFRNHLNKGAFDNLTSA